MDGKIEILLISKDLLLKQVEDLIEIISSQRIGYTGCKEYVIKADRENLELIVPLSCVKLKFKVESKMSPKEEGHLIKMMQSHCRRKIGRACSELNYDIHIERNVEDNSANYYPMYKKEWVWVHETESQNLNHDFDQYAGFGYIGDNPLYILAAQDLDMPKIIWMRDFVLYPPSSMSSKGHEGELEILMGVHDRVKEMVHQGYTYYDVEASIDDCINICEDWNIKAELVNFQHNWMVKNDDNETYDLNTMDDRFLLLHNSRFFGCTLKKWIMNSIDRNILGMDPLVIVSDRRNLDIEGALELPDGSISVSVPTIKDLYL